MSFFQSSRVRQGDPSSSYLFVIGMEALSRLLLKAWDDGFILGFKVEGRGGGGEEISHLLFADDTIVFCEASEEQLTFLCCLLMWFEAMSGLKINLEISEMISIGKMWKIWLAKLATRWGSSLLLTYGFPWRLLTSQ